MRIDFMIFVFHLFCIWTGFCESERPFIETKYGKIQGFDYERSDGKLSEVFLGIPFAKPPIGELRFEKPQAPLRWETVLNASAYGASCPPHNETVPVPPYSEDCLTLGITRPKDSSLYQEGSEKLPVLIWIHGGGYSIGSTSLYPYKGLANIYNPSNIIVVQIQYRLGFLGFFSDGSTSLPGNLGIWDQLEAIKFTREVIESFGGDKEKITIWGLSAGGASVSQLGLTPYSKDLFRSMIAMSGGATMNWAFSDNVFHHSKAIAEEIGCDSGANLKNCLKHTSLETFYKAVQKLGSSDPGLDILKWHPRIDRDLFPSRPEELIKKAPKRPQIMGVSLKESLFFVVLGWTRSIHKLEVNRDDFDAYDKKRFEQFIRDHVAKEEFFGAKKEKAFERILAEYTKGEENAQKSFYLEMYAKLLSDIHFNVGLAREASLRVENHHPTYVYLTEHFNSVLYPENTPVTGATHVCEYPYILEMFTLGKFTIKGDPVEEKVEKTFQQSIIEFVKTGVPKTEISPWPASSESEISSLPYLHITSNPHLSTNFFKKELKFWDDMQKEFGYDLIRFLRISEVKEEEKEEEKEEL
ncbi:unnamed protein product, partial [Mesorhabditis belari]|uniref:Carboxylic ester hydrolase n=1 Tax=Mesorhabditis belari TaxID=2138241 RepID=A0AAF3J490_9BILA